MSQEIKKDIIKIAEDSYKTGFNNACELMIEGFDHLSSMGFASFTVNDVKEMINRIIELNSKSKSDWSKFDL